MTTTLSDRAMLATLNISTWSARKFDRNVSDEVNVSRGAARDAGRYNKLLIAKEALAEVTQAAGSARAFFHARTQPWLYDGTGILSVMGYKPFTDGMRKHREEFDSAVARFVNGYPGHVQEAMNRLNGMFDWTDYPAPEEIGSRFVFQVRIMPVPDSKDFRAAVSDEQAAMIREDIERATKEAVNDAMRGVWKRVAEAVGRMSEKLANYKPEAEGAAKGVFRDSLVGNVRELVEILPSLNITEDPALDAIAERIKRDLCPTEPQVLRDETAARLSVQQAAARILADVHDYI